MDAIEAIKNINQCETRWQMDLILNGVQQAEDTGTFVYTIDQVFLMHRAIKSKLLYFGQRQEKVIH